jgi:HK97 family phage prohead protease
MLVFKQLATEAQAEGHRRMRFVISTGGIDRDGDVLMPAGWQLDAYRKNPVVQFAHDYKALPIAKCVDIRATSTGLEAVVEFPPRGTYDFADTVHDMLKGGFLNATSVGFRPIEFEDDHFRKGKNYLKQELTEFSIVPVPAATRTPSSSVLRRVASGTRPCGTGPSSTVTTTHNRKETP